MKRFSRLKMACIAFVVCAATVIAASAQTLTTLHSFSGTDGSHPYAGLVLASDGNFYGTTDSNGTYGNGTVFKITSAGALTTLYNFAGSDGSNPTAGLIQATDGNLYGTTFGGGAYSDGTVFKITTAGTLTTLHSFAGTDGSNPWGGVVQATDGNFYGTTTSGGAYNDGTVFKITTAGTLTTLHSFAGTDGSSPDAGLVQGTDANLYGTTAAGGANAYGTVFKITLAGTLTTLHSFAGTDGIFPSAGLVQGTDGNFYGTTYESGAYGYGTIFKITSGGTLTTLHSFDKTDGSYPYAVLMQATDGNFYGSTLYGGTYNDGTLFKITATGTLTTLHSFDSTDGSYPKTGLVQGSDGNLYGTTEEGGAYSYYGTVFVLYVGLQPFTSLLSFNGTDGSVPAASLVQATDGNLYGTTAYTGTFADGTAFKITTAGTLTTLYNFCAQPNCADGGDAAGLVLATDGNFYGTTLLGGAYGYGTVFKLTPTGTLTTLYSFCMQTGCPDGSYPAGGVVQGTDGNFYGTTEDGGLVNSSYCPDGCGTVFKITSTGTLTTLHKFVGTDGIEPVAGLAQGTDGNFYGTTYAGGNLRWCDWGCGTVFKITPGGTLTTLYSFCAQYGCTDGGVLESALVQATDGNFYGTAYNGGFNGLGSVFKITPGGTLTTLHTFTGTDGSYPQATLVQATDGNLYGTASGGGANNDYGTIFKITLGGTLTTLHSLAETDGAYPWAGLVQATDGNLYGTASHGGTYNDGTVFKLSVGMGPFVEAVPTSGMVGAAVIILGTNLTGATKVRFNGKVATFTVVSASEITSTVPAGATTGVMTVVTPTGTLKSNVTFHVAPQITTFSPGSGAVGTVVTITGVSLSQTKTVAFGGVRATQFTVVSDTEVQATVPTGAKTGSITITTAGGTATSSGTFTVT